MNKYDSAMEKISVTPEMEERILKNLALKLEVEEVETEKPRARRRWARPAIAATACCAAAMMVVFAYSTYINNSLKAGEETRPVVAIKATDSGHNVAVAIKPINPTEAPKTDEGQGIRVVKGNNEPVTSNNTKGNKLTTAKPGGNINVNPTMEPGKQLANAGSNTTTKPADGDSTKNPGSDKPTGGNVMTGNPIRSCKDINELKKLAGFEFLMPDKLPEGYSLGDISLISGTMVQLSYSNNTDTIVYRTEAGDKDISGVYEEFAKEEKVKLGDFEVTLKGDEKVVKLAVWNSSGYAYSLSFSNGCDKDAVGGIITGLK